MSAGLHEMKILKKKTIKFDSLKKKRKNGKEFWQWHHVCIMVVSCGIKSHKIFSNYDNVGKWNFYTHSLKGCGFLCQHFESM